MYEIIKNIIINISIIIPTYNAEKTIIQTLKGLENQTNKDFEVIVIDDGSTDSSFELVKSYKTKSRFPIKLIKQKNSGPAKARNLGVEQSEGNIILFLDSDCIPYINWVEEMVRPLDGKIVGSNCGYIVQNKESLIARYIGYEIAKRHEKLVGKYIDTIGTYSAGFTKRVFIEAGGFDINYRKASGEDFDLAFNIKKIGYELVFTDKTFVYHYHPDSLRKYLKQQFYRGYWRVRMYLRNKDKIVKGDSYTGYEAQIQFILSCFALLSILMIFFYPIITFFGLGILVISNIPLGLWTFRKERKFIIIAPLLATMRSLAGTFGVGMYFVEKVFK
ncbi:Glycosyltransferase AglE [uncultured archaeon]|nr:Glycosyltransferase AglE [uncultured archaeon]